MYQLVIKCSYLFTYVSTIYVHVWMSIYVSEYVCVCVCVCVSVCVCMYICPSTCTCICMYTDVIFAFSSLSKVKCTTLFSNPHVVADPVKEMYSPGDVVSFHCNNSDYILVGSSTIICDEKGNIHTKNSYDYRAWV